METIIEATSGRANSMEKEFMFGLMVRSTKEDSRMPCSMVKEYGGQRITTFMKESTKITKSMVKELIHGVMELPLLDIFMKIRIRERGAQLLLTKRYISRKIMRRNGVKRNK